MAIEGIIGRPGSGKTYELTRRALLQADRGRIVYSNYPINHQNVFVFRPAQLLDLPPGVVVIDEAHLWFPSRMALKLPASWLMGMSQTRKNGWDLIWSAQHETRVDRMIRDVTAWMHLARTWGRKDDHPRAFTYRTWEPEYFRKADKMAGRGFSFFSRRVAESYDTHGHIGLADHTQDPKDVYAKRGGSVLDGVI